MTAKIEHLDTGLQIPFGLGLSRISRSCQKPEHGKGLLVHPSFITRVWPYRQGTNFLIVQTSIKVETNYRIKGKGGGERRERRERENDYACLVKYFLDSCPIVFAFLTEWIWERHLWNALPPTHRSLYPNLDPQINKYRFKTLIGWKW